jgi:hypothetical protein
VPPEKQLLYLNDVKLEDGGKTLKDLDIKAGSELTLKHVIVKISINVEKYDGTRFQLEVKPEDTILIVKEKIFAARGIAVASQKLDFAGEMLENSKNLTDYGIKKNSTIQLYGGEFQILVKFSTN